MSWGAKHKAAEEQRVEQAKPSRSAEVTAVLRAVHQTIWQSAREFPDRYGLSALAVYAAASVLFFGRGVLGQLSTAQIGKGRDPQLLMWFLAWWPHAIANYLNPFFSRTVFAPQGVNLAWTTCVPLMSILAAPITLGFGPTVTYNVLCMLCPALAGWAAFILCRDVTDAWWPSLMGGYLFAFSSYMVGQADAHLAVLLVFPIPLFAWWALRGLRGEVKGAALVGGMTLALLVQFLCEIEIFATMTMFIAIGAILTLLFTSGDWHEAALRMLKPLVQSYALVLLVVSPYLYSIFSSGYEAGPINPPLFFSADLLNFLVPTPAMELGRLKTFEAVTSRFPGNIFEATGYIGVPLILVAAGFARDCWRYAWGKTLVFFAIVAAVLSLGPFLLVGGRIVSPAPAGLLLFLPMMNKALPCRFTLYSFLALAVMTAIWLHRSKTSRIWRGIAAATIVLSMLPNLSEPFWTTPLTLPRFFTEGSYRKYVVPGENVLVLPWGDLGDADLWQLRADWYFRLAGGYVGPTPGEARSWPIFYAFQQYGSVLLPEPALQLKSFLASHRVGLIIVDDRYRRVWAPLLATLGAAGIEAGGVTLYRLPSVELARDVGATASDLELHARQQVFAALLLATDEYLAEGRLPMLLSASALQWYHLIPNSWITIPPRPYESWSEGGLRTLTPPCGSYGPPGFYSVDAESDAAIRVGVGGSLVALRQVRKEYRSYATSQKKLVGAPDECGRAAKYFSRLFAMSIGLPDPVIDSDSQTDAWSWLTMTFDRRGLEQAAHHAHSIFSNEH